MLVHWQLPLSATAEERKRLCFKFLRNVLNTCGRFGCEEYREWLCIVGMNEKGGMNNKKFERYFDNSIVLLFPNLEDMPGKCILLKVDSGHGCNWWDLLNKCWFRGVYIYPGLPNSTPVQQEMDINYGPFKGVVQRNLANIAMTCYAKGITMSLGTSTFGLIRGSTGRFLPF